MCCVHYLGWLDIQKSIINKYSWSMKSQLLVSLRVIRYLKQIILQLGIIIFPFIRNEKVFRIVFYLVLLTHLKYFHFRHQNLKKNILTDSEFTVFSIPWKFRQLFIIEYMSKPKWYLIQYISKLCLYAMVVETIKINAIKMN